MTRRSQPPTSRDPPSGLHRRLHDIIGTANNQWRSDEAATGTPQQAYSPIGNGDGGIFAAIAIQIADGNAGLRDSRGLTALEVA